jgi:NAD(P)-dependent dehydrogenase (short-subunit alcohol dehydrogenase family)
MSRPQAVLIVGGGLGIGLEITKAILSLSPTAKIVVFGLHIDSELEASSNSEAVGGRLWCLNGDVTCAADRIRAVEFCQLVQGGIDTLVYCAGIITPIERIENVDIEAVKRSFDVNVFGAIAMVNTPPTDSHTQMTLKLVRGLD